jgi:broad specificity phosphatase PhoE
MRITLVRHARTSDAEAKIAQSEGSTLSLSGKEQAKRVGERLKRERFDHAYVSPLTRATETWEAIKEHHPELQHEFKELIVESDRGIFKGRLREEYKKAMEAANLPFGHYRPPEGESMLDTLERVEQFWNHLKSQDKEHVLVVTHGIFLTMLFKHLLNLPLTREAYDRHQPENTAITIIDVDDDKIDIQLFNDDSHLERK